MNVPISASASIPVRSSASAGAFSAKSESFLSTSAGILISMVTAFLLSSLLAWVVDSFIALMWDPTEKDGHKLSGKAAAKAEKHFLHRLGATFLFVFAAGMIGFGYAALKYGRKYQQYP